MRRTASGERNDEDSVGIGTTNSPSTISYKDLSGKLHLIRSFANFSGFRCIYAHFDDQGLVKNFELQVQTDDKDECAHNSRDMLMKSFDLLKDAVLELAFRESIFDRATELEAAEAAVAADFASFRFPRVGDDKWKSAMRSNAAYQQLHLSLQVERGMPLRTLNDFVIHDKHGQICRSAWLCAD